VPPECDPGHVYHLFPVLTSTRDAFQAHLAARGVGTLVHYPVAIPRQPAFSAVAGAECPNADRVAAEVCSLPLHPALSPDDLAVVVDAVQSARAVTQIR
jgi:dTDP-4-amino-4,6-dideoxygalactose transaminase